MKLTHRKEILLDFLLLFLFAAALDQPLLQVQVLG